MPPHSMITTCRFGSLGWLHQLCQLDHPGDLDPAFCTLNLGYDEPNGRKFAVFSEYLRLSTESDVTMMPLASQPRRESDANPPGDRVGGRVGSFRSENPTRQIVLTITS